MTMLNEASLVDRIERAQTDRPYCGCGRETVISYRDFAMWLECDIVSEPIEGPIKRAWNAISAPDHVRQLIVEVPAPKLRVA